MRSFATLYIILAASLGAFAAPLNAPGNPIDTVKGDLPARQLPGVGSIVEEVQGLTGGLGARQLGVVTDLASGLTGGLGVRQLPEVPAVAGPLTGLAGGGLPVRQVQGLSEVTGLTSGLLGGAHTGGLGLRADVGADASTDKLPTGKVDGAVAKAEQEVPRDVAGVKAGVSAPKAEGQTDIAVRGAPSTQSVVVIIQNTWTQVTPLCQKLQYVNKANATAASVKPVIAEIQTHLLKATTDMKALVDLKLGAAVLLKGADGAVISIGVFAQFLAINVICIVRALAVLVAHLGADIKGDIMPLVFALGEVVYGFVAIQFTLVAGLSAQLCPLVVAIAADLKVLGFVHLTALLKL
ncbi:hypothetical protein CONPUDRAFT_169203 [Coniophora puteana RWD-64-598 SS2]|uniref:Uncharacterized protein n=1 Tax=Coniophora puteana (strain RWD-64-598) TaxID=741705 RepID=A0A5M3MA44_CONPW|nr:uncharacterized protein CONPUDRAFT_169203 [Coniophora puteana RWD-64-598 SS2]EIW75977.1 hypothetical protein CONPUDRAFT_169203 [Coniophora puteana RWD-64-598 SS2]